MELIPPINLVNFAPVATGITAKAHLVEITPANDSITLLLDIRYYIGSEEMTQIRSYKRHLRVDNSTPVNAYGQPVLDMYNNADWENPSVVVINGQKMGEYAYLIYALDNGADVRTLISTGVQHADTVGRFINPD